MKKALRKLFGGMRINQRNGNTQLVARNFLDIGNLYIKMGKLDSASENVQNALEIFLTIGNQVRIAKAQLTKVKYILLPKCTMRALIWPKKRFSPVLITDIRRSLQVPQDYCRRSIWPNIDSVRHIIIRRSKSNGNDSLFLGDKQKTLARLELQYQFDKKDQQNKIIQQRRIFFIVLLSYWSYSVVLSSSWYDHIQLKDKKSDTREEKS